MRKKIGVDELVVGMYVTELCGSWMDHPFWRSAFVLSEAKQISALQSSKIREVWIDVEPEADVPDQAAPRAVQGADASPLEQVAGLEQRPLAPVAIADELARAAQICAQSAGQWLKDARRQPAQAPMRYTLPFRKIGKRKAVRYGPVKPWPRNTAPLL